MRLADGHAFMHTPHIDHLAATGTLFTRAYVQYSFCAPSRNSFMSVSKQPRPATAVISCVLRATAEAHRRMLPAQDGAASGRHKGVELPR